MVLIDFVSKTYALAHRNLFMPCSDNKGIKNFQNLTTYWSYHKICLKQMLQMDPENKYLTNTLSFLGEFPFPTRSRQNSCIHTEVSCSTWNTVILVFCCCTHCHWAGCIITIWHVRLNWTRYWLHSAFLTEVTQGTILTLVHLVHSILIIICSIWTWILIVKFGFGWTVMSRRASSIRCWSSSITIGFLRTVCTLCDIPQGSGICECSRGTRIFGRRRGT